MRLAEKTRWAGSCPSPSSLWALPGPRASPATPRGRCGRIHLTAGGVPGEEPLPWPRPPPRLQTRKTHFGSWECAPDPHGHAAPEGLFSWHPVFMALAASKLGLRLTGPLLCSQFCLCMAEAILLFSPEHSPFFFCSRKARIRLHWAGQTLAILCAALGLGFIISSRTRSELPHLVSWHSWLGALTLLATGGQAVCGLCLLCPRAARVSRVARLKLYHLTCGLVVYLMATVTVLLGMSSVWFRAQIKGVAWYLCLMLPLYPALVIMHQISSSYLPRKKLEM
ncbi:probable transmembrane reductase CYB561D1 isoform X1 [Manis javanica]|uniref:probable transmembrane reductase CYB561D1 isoform X1 n=1 Tax=Manis javanica TaxID=9974 RepID=UPI003C6DA1C1